MKMHSTLLAAAVMGAAATVAAAPAQAAQTLRAAIAGDQVPATLVAAPLPASDSERVPLAFAWALDPAQPLQAPGVYAAVSRSYWQQVDAAELQRGVDLPLTAPDAVIQLSPAAGARALPAEALQVRDAAGLTGVARSVDARQLQAAGMPVSDGSSMLRTGAGSAVGAYRLQSAQAQGRYVVQVLEPNSPVRLEVQADQAQVLAGGSVQLQARLLEDGASTAKLATRRGSLGGEALLVAPDGRSWPQRLLRTTDGSLGAQVRIPAEASTTQGLWELQVFAQADGVLRDGKVAFAVAQPTARFSGQATPDVASRQVALPLQVAAAGRYEARGTLYATGADGQLRPVAQAHAAAWFEGPGRGALVLPFDQAALPAGFGAPYELRDLQLQDQSRMAPIESRALALRF
ncbi:DUF4785 domain-containing protein [Stenotrophomonas sp. NPDC077659]|uniref:DUF4785 domain-containing protein n=1 Tax=Stenotrophomonas sp. NPDC077659 TaxID=3390694 RepID=UPI003D0829CE